LSGIRNQNQRIYSKATREKAANLLLAETLAHVPTFVKLFPWKTHRKTKKEGKIQKNREKNPTDFDLPGRKILKKKTGRKASFSGFFKKKRLPNKEKTGMIVSGVQKGPHLMK